MLIFALRLDGDTVRLLPEPLKADGRWSANTCGRRAEEFTRERDADGYAYFEPNNTAGTEIAYWRLHPTPTFHVKLAWDNGNIAGALREIRQ